MSNIKEHLNSRVWNGIKHNVIQIKTSNNRVIEFNKIISSGSLTDRFIFQIGTNEYLGFMIDEDEGADSTEFLLKIEFDETSFELNLEIQDYDWDGTASAHYYVYAIDGKIMDEQIELNHFDGLIERLGELIRQRPKSYKIEFSEMLS